MRQRKHKYELRRRVELDAEMMESEAFRSLSGQKAVWTLLRFVQKCPFSFMKRSGQKIKVVEKNDIMFTYGEANHFGISTSRFHEIIRELYEKGFIDIEHQGGGVGRDPSTYKLVDDWKEWPTVKRERKRVLQQGLDVQAHRTRRTQKTTLQRKGTLR